MEGAQGEDQETQGGGAGDEFGSGVVGRIAQNQTAQRETDSDGEGGSEEDGERLHRLVREPGSGQNEADAGTVGF